MRLKLTLSIILLSASFLVRAQEHNHTHKSNEFNGKRVEVKNNSPEVLELLLKSGVDLRCGAVYKEDVILLELTDSEIENLKANKIEYKVLIEDLTSFYVQRAKKGLPKAQEKLKKEKLWAKNKKKKNIASKSANSITNTAVDSYLQYYGEQEVDWTPPTNFNIPSTFGGCLKVSETEAVLDAMRAAYPNLITVKADASPTNQKTYGYAAGTNVSDRWDGQTVYYVKISDGIPANGADINDPNEPDILYTSMIHSRELSSLMGNIYFMWYLLENYATDTAIKNLVDNNELYFVPIVNPDGLKWNEKYAPNGGGLNRTNLRGFSTIDPTNNSNYNLNYGVDPNRNFNYLWGSAGESSGSSGNYWESTYRGPSAFSEPESQIMRDFVLSKKFKIAVWHHSYANAIPHPYGGVPSKVSGREDEMARWHQDMTRYNRYITGAEVLTPANGIADDWMLGGTADGNGSVGSGLNILATTSENGAYNGSEGGFWPAPNQIVPIAKRMVRINLMNAYYGGKYAKFHDLTPSNINSTTSNLTFGIERVGQTKSDFTITVTPISSNISSVGSAVTETGMNVLEQRNVTIQLNLNAGILAKDKIEYKVTLSNADGAIYEANFEKYYQPTVLFQDNPDADGITNWTSSGIWTTSTSQSWSGTSIEYSAPAPYSNNSTRTLTTSNSYDLSGAPKVLVQFYTTWDTERNYDFVELIGSPDGGTTWYNLNGKYNKPNSSTFTNSAHSTSFSPVKSSTNKSFQDNNSSGLVYDGDQMGNWVLEEIVIDASTNSELFNATDAQFRFRFLSDSNNRTENYTTDYAGFYFDDFKIIKAPCNLTVPTNVNATTITASTATINWDDAGFNYDLRYRKTGTSTWTNVSSVTTNTSNLSGLSALTEYEVQVRTKCDSQNSSYSSSTIFTTLVAPPCTGTLVNSYPYLETFDAGIGSWTQDTSDNGNWVLNTGITPTSGTGPSDDYTSGGKYFYMEANSLTEGQIINLISPCFDLTNYTNSSFSFYYYMYGRRMGNLKLDITTDNGAIWTNLLTITGQQHTSSGDSWKTQTVNLSAYDGQTIKLRLSGTRGNGNKSDMAIDHFSFTADAEGLLGIYDENLSKFNVYPNPTSNGLVNIDMPNDINEFTITVSSLLGKKVYSEDVKLYNTNKHSFYVNKLASGVYLLTVSTDLDRASKKIIIE